jgi:hypothetical protein
MIKYFRSIIVIITSLLALSCYSQKEKAQRSNDSTFLYQERFEKYLTAYQEMYPFKIDDESQGTFILATEEELIQFIHFVFKHKYPKAQYSKIKISEDKTGKIWFAYTTVTNSMMMQPMMIIVCKGSCKVLLFEMDR